MKEKYLWFSHIDNLNDPFECNITKLEYSSEIYVEEREKYSTKYARDIGNSFLRGMGPPNHYYDHPESGINPKFQSEFDYKIHLYGKYQKHRNNIFILSLSTSNLSPAMWAHYAISFQGISIKLNSESLEDTLDKSKHDWKKISVKYTKEVPSYTHDIEKDIEQLISYKHPDWSYENEVRYVIWTKKNGNIPGMKVSIGDAISEIQLGNLISFQKEKSIRDSITDLPIKKVVNTRRGWFKVK